MITPESHVFNESNTISCPPPFVNHTYQCRNLDIQTFIDENGEIETFSFPLTDDEKFRILSNTLLPLKGLSPTDDEMEKLLLKPESQEYQTKGIDPSLIEQLTDLIKSIKNDLGHQ